MTLADDIAARPPSNFTAERTAIYKKAQEHIEASDILETALSEGDIIPMFSLPDAFGNTVNMAEILKRGPAVISFYRGAWCPFCNLELRALQRELGDADAAGITLIAISPNTPDTSKELVNENDLSFRVLSDRENAVAKQFNIVYEMEASLAEYYADHDRDIAGMNGSDVWELPVPATYVVDQDGSIAYSYVNLNHRERAEPADVVAIAAGLVA